MTQDNTTVARRKLRTLAMQTLAHCGAQGPAGARDLEHFVADPDLAENILAEQDLAFVRRRVEAVTERWAEIDRLIVSASANWDLKRMAVPDRAILRLAVGEMLFLDDVPVRVAMDEAIELARTYGGKESPQFINGVLDAIYRKHHEPPAEEPPSAEEQPPA